MKAKGRNHLRGAIVPKKGDSHRSSAGLDWYPLLEDLRLCRSDSRHFDFKHVLGIYRELVLHGHPAR